MPLKQLSYRLFCKLKTSFQISYKYSLGMDQTICRMYLLSTCMCIPIWMGSLVSQDSPQGTAHHEYTVELSVE